MESGRIFMVLQYSSYAKYIAALITIVLVAILFTQINLGDVITTLKNINPIYLIAGFILYTCSYFFRAWRFHILLNKEISIKDLFHIVCVHNMLNNLLPARTGELSYVYLLKKVNRRTTGEGVASLIVARIFDFIAIGTLFLLSFLLVNDVSGVIKNAIWAVVLLIIGFFILLWGLFVRGTSLLNQVKRILVKYHLNERKFGDYIIRKGEDTIGALDKIHIRKSGFRVLILSLCIWVSCYSLNLTLMWAMGIKISFFMVLLGSTFAILTTILPIQGIGGFGTFEAGWTIGFLAVGLSNSEAISSGFVAHIIGIVFYIVLGLIGYFYLSRGIIKQ